jgi:hypothetical protein
MIKKTITMLLLSILSLSIASAVSVRHETTKIHKENVFISHQTPLSQALISTRQNYNAFEERGRKITSRNGFSMLGRRFIIIGSVLPAIGTVALGGGILCIYLGAVNAGFGFAYALSNAFSLTAQMAGYAISGIALIITGAVFISASAFLIPGIILVILGAVTPGNSNKVSMLENGIGYSIKI